MDKFAFLFHPSNLDILADKGIQEQGLKTKNRRLVERSLRWLSPVKRATAIVNSIAGNSAEGEMIMVPLLCSHILNMDKKFVLEKVIEAGQLAKNLNVKIIGLGAYLASVGRKGALISEALNIPVTSGTTYTIAIALEATMEAARRVGIEIDEAKICIIGATGSIGKTYARMLANKVNSLILVARRQTALKTLCEEIHNNYGFGNIMISENIKEAVNQSDIVLISTNSPSELLTIDDLPPGCVVCDISIPHNIAAKENGNEVLVIDGGLVQCPGDQNFDYLNLSHGMAYACLSEVMILTLEGKFENYSSGGNISEEKILEIGLLAKKHGFELSRLTSFGVPVNDEQIEKVRKARLRNKMVKAK